MMAGWQAVAGGDAGRRPAGHLREAVAAAAAGVAGGRRRRRSGAGGEMAAREKKKKLFRFSPQFKD